MPAKTRYDLFVVDRSPLARNLYQVLFSNHERFRINLGDEFQSLFKRSVRFRPDLLLVNSNALESAAELKFPCPTILIVSKNRSDILENMPQVKHLGLLEKPFYPYELLSLANRMVQDKRESKPRGRPPGRRKKRG